MDRTFALFCAMALCGLAQEAAHEEAVTAKPRYFMLANAMKLRAYDEPNPLIETGLVRVDYLVRWWNLPKTTWGTVSLYKRNFQKPALGGPRWVKEISVPIRLEKGSGVKVRTNYDPISTNELTLYYKVELSVGGRVVARAFTSIEEPWAFNEWEE